MEQDQDILTAIKAVNRNLEMSYQAQGVNANLLDDLVGRVTHIEQHNAVYDEKFIGACDKIDKVYHEMFIGTNGSTKAKLDIVNGKLASSERKWKWVGGILATIIISIVLAGLNFGWRLATTYTDNSKLLESIQQLQNDVKRVKEDRKDDKSNVAPMEQPDPTTTRPKSAIKRQGTHSMLSQPADLAKALYPTLAELQIPALLPDKE